MSESKTQENQHELFSDFSSEVKAPERMPFIAKAQKPILISTTTEQILLVSILAIFILCFIFFLGVLRGRSSAQPIQAASTQPFVTNRSIPKPMLRPAAQGPAPAPSSVAPGVPAGVSPVRTPAVQIKKSSPVINARELLKPYTIQVLTTKKKEYAENECALLKKTGFYALIIPSGEYYQVCAGLYSNKDEAKRDLAFFASKYRGSYLRRR